MKRLDCTILATIAFIIMTILLVLGGCSIDTEPAPYYAIDGDTIAVGPKWWGLKHIRLLRIDAPELPGHNCVVPVRRVSCDDHHHATAYAAKRYLQWLLNNGGRMVCKDQPDRPLDVYGRRLSECTMALTGVNLSNAMLASGLAVPYSYKGKL